MTHYIKSLVLSLLFVGITNCSEEVTLVPDKNPPPPPDCIAPTIPTLAPVTQLSVKAQSGLPFHQEKLVPLLVLPLNDGICYIEHSGPIAFHKMTAKKSSGNFDQFPEASQDLVKEWSKIETTLKLPLAGMTAVSYFGTGPNESMIRTDILLSSNATPWHLWHEFSHYLFAEARNEKISIQSFNPPTIEEVDASRQEFIALVKAKADLMVSLEALKKTFALHELYDSRVHLEEIVIELNLLNITAQEKSPLVKDADVKESLNIINLFHKKHHVFYMTLFKEVSEVLKDEPDLRNWYLVKRKKWILDEDELLSDIQKAQR